MEEKEIYFEVMLADDGGIFQQNVTDRMLCVDDAKLKHMIGSQVLNIIRDAKVQDAKVLIKVQLQLPF